MSIVFSSIVPCVSKMVELHASGLRVPIFFPIDANKFPYVSFLHLSIRFLFQDNTISIERKIYDLATFLLSLTMRENSKHVDNGSSMWEIQGVQIP